MAPFLDTKVTAAHNFRQRRRTKACTRGTQRARQDGQAHALAHTHRTAHALTRTHPRWPRTAHRRGAWRRRNTRARTYSTRHLRTKVKGRSSPRVGWSRARSWRRGQRRTGRRQGRRPRHGGRPRCGNESEQLDRICKRGSLRKGCSKMETSARSRKTTGGGEFEGSHRRRRRSRRGSGWTWRRRRRETRGKMGTLGSGAPLAKLK